MSIHTDFNILTEQQERQVLGWLTRRLQDCLELDTPDRCAELAQQIWKLYQHNDFYADHRRSSQEVLDKGIAHDSPEAQQQRTEMMLQEIVKLLANTQSFHHVMGVEGEQNTTTWLTQVMTIIHFHQILTAVEVVTGT